MSAHGSLADERLPNDRSGTDTAPTHRTSTYHPSTTTETTMAITDPNPLDAGAQPTTLAYRLSQVTKTFAQKGREVRALAGVDLDIAQGDFVTIQGPTGGGKSTLLQVLGALEKPTTGQVLIGDTDLAHASAGALGRVRASEIGFVFQAFNLIPTLTAAENVEMGLEPAGLSKHERAERVSDALARVGLSERADHRPAELSGGQQQRVAIARAIAKRPRVLLADEPTGNLDESMRDDILAVLEQLNADGLTLIVVTHDSAVARRARRRLRLEKGIVRDITA